MQNTPPELNSKWEHYNGNLYEVILIANEYTEYPDKYPITVVYKGNNGRIWCRPLTKWFDSFTLIV